MTHEQIKQFYRDIADVCAKHNISGIAGVWFSGHGHDEFGEMNFFDPTDFRIKYVIENISEKYYNWAKDAIPIASKKLGSIHEIKGGTGEAN